MLLMMMVMTEMTMKIVIVIMITMMSKEKHPSLPLFLVGHSMGGMIALRCVIRSFISPPPYTIIVVQVVTNAFEHHFLKS